jgi:IS30 family transposase
MHHQIAPDERYVIGRCRTHGWSVRAIARLLDRPPSTISRELRRNRCEHDGAYRHEIAQRKAQNRRHVGHRAWRFSVQDWDLVLGKLEEWWSPEQIADTLRAEGRLRISHETIYRFIWRNHRLGGELHRCLRGARKQKRKRYGTYERRGRLAQKRPLATRPAVVAARGRIGDWEIDTILGAGSKTCVLALVERATGYLLLGLLADRSAAGVRARALQLLTEHRGRVHTITADNGTEFHQYAAIERALGAEFYFAPPYQAWARGTCENTIGLVRQYLPKGMSFAGLTQAHCTHIARHLNRRPRKRLGSRTPEACYEAAA